MDHKRQEITDCHRTLQELKEKVHSLTEEKVMKHYLAVYRILVDTNSHVCGQNYNKKNIFLGVQFSLLKFKPRK